MIPFTNFQPSGRTLRLALVAGIALLALPATGCVIGRTSDRAPIDRTALGSIEIGKTTRGEVTKKLGPPDEIIFSNLMLDKLEERAYRYRRSNRKISAFFLILFGTFRSDTRFDEILIFFDSNGIVEDFGTRFNADDASYGWP